MRTEEKHAVKNSIGRLAFVLLSVGVQVGWIALLFISLNDFSTGISVLSSLLAFLLVLYIYGKHTNAAFKMPWIILLLIFPIFGLCMYLLFGNSETTRRMQRRFEEIDHPLFTHLNMPKTVIKELEQRDFAIANQARYIQNFAKYPVYNNTDVEFYGDAADGLKAQIDEIKKAKSFIFMEYHAIEEAASFSQIKAALAERARNGVEVRLFYDEMGSIGFINRDFIKRMEAEGIQCRVFNPIIPILNVFMNNRDHRKITVVDGRVGFTGGYNLADEYFNLTHPYGHWKDSGLKLTGDAVKSLTVMFLEMWNAMKKSDTDYSPYLPKFPYQAAEAGFVQPYADSPLDDEYVGENVYLNMIKNAKHQLYIATPYLIISDEMNRELSLAAKRGVDVRVITPGIPDKKVIYKVTRSYYAGLAQNGVRVYEYKPGFLHEKQFYCDGEAAVVGTINMDYRSLYHHFENAVYLYGLKAVDEIGKDFASTFLVSDEVTERYKDKRSAVLRFGQCILRLFSPLM